MGKIPCQAAGVFVRLLILGIAALVHQQYHPALRNPRHLVGDEFLQFASRHEEFEIDLRWRSHERSPVPLQCGILRRMV